MKASWRKLGKWEGQKWKNLRERWGELRDLRINDASAGVRARVRVKDSR